ncbi:MAG: F0F1 ATP synthase subunit A [Bryobacteraceae bacterium]
MPEHELWVTALFNRYLAGVANGILGLFGLQAHDPAHPWTNYMVLQILVAVIIMGLFAFLRTRLSADKPGAVQHVFEIIYGFLRNQAEEAAGHAGARFLPFFGTIFFFILFGNLLGVIPTFESPTMFPSVTVGCAILVFLYYNFVGIREVGVGKYLAHFIGPIWWLAFLMIPIEIVSHLARPLSLSLRLYANMFAGEQVTMAFLGLTYLIVPVIFMALHLFVAFLQAYVFTLLTMIYVGGAVAHEEH